MKNKKIEELIADYISGILAPDQVVELEELLQQNGYDSGELAEIMEVHKNLDNYKIPDPDKRMDKNFRMMLKNFEEKKIIKNRNFFTPISHSFNVFINNQFIPKLSFSLLLILFGWVIGFWITPEKNYKEQLTNMNTELTGMKEIVMLNLLEQQSPTDRIKAVNLTSNFNDINDQIIDALLNTLNNDPNENVRLVTVEALSEYLNNPKVKDGLIRSIAYQDSPIIQISLAEIMAILNEKTALPFLQDILNKNQLSSFARTRLEESIKVLL